MRAASQLCFLLVLAISSHLDLVVFLFDEVKLLSRHWQGKLRWQGWGNSSA